jgi:hypothetical protein
MKKRNHKTYLVSVGLIATTVFACSNANSQAEHEDHSSVDATTRADVDGKSKEASISGSADRQAKSSTWAHGPVNSSSRTNFAPSKKNGAPVKKAKDGRIGNPDHQLVPDAGQTVSDGETAHGREMKKSGIESGNSAATETRAGLTAPSSTASQAMKDSAGASATAKAPGASGLFKKTPASFDPSGSSVPTTFRPGPIHAKASRPKSSPKKVRTNGLATDGSQLGITANH